MTTPSCAKSKNSKYIDLILTNRKKIKNYDPLDVRIDDYSFTVPALKIQLSKS